MFIEPLGPLGRDGFGQEGFAGPGLGSGFLRVVGSGDEGLFGRIERTSDGTEVLDPMGLALLVGILGRVGRNAFGEDVFPGTCPGPGLREVVGSIDEGLDGRGERASLGVEVTASTGLTLVEGTLGRFGLIAFGEDVIPGTGLGPGLRGVVGSLDGGLAGLTELTSAGDDVIACIGLRVFIGSLGRLGRDGFGEDGFVGPGLGPGLP